MKNQIQLILQAFLPLAFLLAATTIQGQISNTELSPLCCSGEKCCSSKILSEPNQRSSGSTSLGPIQANTNPALPASYNFMEYVYAEPDDQGVCIGATNRLH